MKHSGQTVLWELWAALCLCTALVLPPGSPWLHEPALLYPGPSAKATTSFSIRNNRRSSEITASVPVSRHNSFTVSGVNFSSTKYFVS